MFHDSSTIRLDSLGCMEVSFTHRSVRKTLLSRKGRHKKAESDLEKCNEMVHGLMISILSLRCALSPVCHIQFTTSEMKLY